MPQSSFTTEPIIQFQDQRLNFSSLCQALEQVGINYGDEICVHTSLYRLGKILVSPEVFLKTCIAALREVIGSTGTLLMPAFTYSYCDHKTYDLRNSRSKMGILTEYYRQLPECCRTYDPIFSFALSGAHIEPYLQNSQSCFGPNSVYDVLTKRNGKIVVMGERWNGYTFVHYVEETVPVSYRYYKNFSGTLIDEQGQAHQTSINYFVRNLERRSIISGAKVLNFLEHQQLACEIPLGGGELCAFPCIAAKKALQEQMKKDELSLLLD